jgi:hypothetical protein
MKCVIVSQGVATPQLPVYVCRSGNSHQETLIYHIAQRERERERQRKKKGINTEKLTLDLGKVARVSKTTAKHMQRGKS